MPWWGKSSEPKPEPPKEAKDSSDAPQNKTFDPDRLPAREKLPASLQKIVNKADTDSRFFDEVVEG